MGIFDGLTGVLNATFGAPVTHTPPVGATEVIQGVFREEPAAVTTEDGGEVLVLSPNLRVPANLAAGIVRGSEIAPENGKRYVVIARQDNGIPAANAFVVFELELVA